MDCVSVKVISRFIKSVKREIREWHFPVFIMILSEKSINFSMISHEITKITCIVCEQDYIT